MVVGNINKDKCSYVPKASIVLRGNRKDIDIDEVVDTTPVGIAFHPECLKIVKKETFVTTTYKTNTDYRKAPTRTGFREDKSWVYGAKWNNKDACWEYGNTAEGVDIIILNDKNAKDLEGRINKMSIAGLQIKVSSLPWKETSANWDDILCTEIDELHESVADAYDFDKLVDSIYDDDDDDTSLIILPGKVGERSSARDRALAQLMFGKDED